MTAKRFTRMLQGAVLVAVAASVPAVWGAGGGVKGVQVNNIAAGNAAITRDGNVMTVRTATQNTIINYQRFNVTSGETVQFLQPTSTSRVLNRIKGNEPSFINGTIYSNGKVYFINPSGVIFGEGSVVTSNGLVAAAGHISDANFMAGINRFTGNTGSVVNYGTIRAEDIHLVGGSVANFGSILTTGSGVVTMTAGKDVYIGETNSPTGGSTIMVKVSSDKPVTKEGTGVSNSGTVDAGGGQISMGAGDLYAAGIYNNGTLKGAVISSNAGASSNVNEGKIDASSATGKGGSIEVLGDKVGIFAGTVDASGATGGGSIKIGGDFHGSPGTLASSVTVVSPGALILADAVTSGDGGKVAIWADQVTSFYGSVSARGGATGGNGGFVEISGKSNLAFGGSADVSAALGAAGTLLFDPGTILINATGGSDGSLTNSFNTGTASDFAFSATSIMNLSGSVILTALNDINVNSSISFTGSGVTAFSLISTAGDINLAKGVKIESTSQPLTLNAGGNILLSDTGVGFVSAELKTTTGNINLVAGNNVILQASNSDAFAAKITTSGGGVDIRADGTILVDSGNSGAASITSGGGPISLRSTTNVTLEGNSAGIHAIVSSTGSGVGGSILLSAGDTGLGGTSGIITVGNFATIASGGGNITFRSSSLSFGSGHNQTISGGTGVVAFETNDGTTTIGLGGGSGTLQVDNNEIGRISDASVIRIGANGTQSGAITARNYTMPLALSGVPLEINSNAGAGSVILDDTGGNGITVAGDLTIRAGTGGIKSLHADNGNPEINFAGSNSSLLTLNSLGGIGAAGKRLEIFTFSGSVSVTNTATAGNDVLLTGISNGLNFTNLTNTQNVTDVISAGDINASGVISGTNVILNASGGIGTTAPLAINASVGASLTTHGNGSLGNIHLLAVGATLGSFTFTTTGTGVQTETIDGTGDLSVGTGVTAATGDALVINASGNLFASGATLSGLTVSLHAGTSGIGNLILTAAQIVGDTVILQAGNGSGSGAVLLTGLNFSGSTADAPSVVQVLQDASITSVPVLGTSTALTLVSNLGTVGINTDLTLLSLVATGGTIVLSANATVSGAMTFNGPVLLKNNSELVGGSSLTLTGAIASQGGGGFSLRTHFGGVTTLTGGTSTTIGQELGSFTVDAAGGSLVIGDGTSSVIRTTGNVLIGEPLKLNGSLTVTSTLGGSVRFNDTIDSAGSPHSPLVINTTGATTFDGDVGSITPVGGVTVLGGGLVFLGNATSSQFSMTVGSPILFSGPVTLLTDTLLTATGGTTGTVTFESEVNSFAFSQFNLTVNASDAVTFSDVVGDPLASGELGTLDVTGTSIVLGSASVSDMAVNTGDGQNYHGPVTLLSDTTLSDSFGSGIVLNNPVSSGSSSPHYGLSIFAAGEIDIVAGTATGSANLLQSLMTGGGGITHFGGAGAVTVVTIGSQIYNDQVTLDDTTTFQVTGAGSSMAFFGTPLAMNAGSFDVTLIANSMTFAGTGSSVTGTGHLTLLPLTASNDVLIQSSTGTAANTLVLGAGDMANFSGFSLVTIGYSDGSGTISVNSPTTFGAPTLLQAPSGGSIATTANISTIGSLTLSATTIDLGASLFTDGGNMKLQGAVNLTNGPVTLKTYGTGVGGFITVIGTIDGAHVLNLLTNGPGGDGATDLQGVIGGTTPLTGLNASGGAMTIHGNITTAGPINIGTSHLFLVHTGTAATSTTTILTHGGLFHSSAPIDGDGSGAIDLVIDTSTGGAAGPITLSSVGASGTLNNLTLIAIGGGGNGGITLADVTINGAFSSNGSTFLSTGAINTLGAAGISINQSSTVEFDAALNSHGNPITISGTQILAMGAVTGSQVTLTGTALVSLTQPMTATSTLTITGVGISTGTAGALTGAPVILNGGSGNVILGAAVNATGGFSSTASGLFTLQGTGSITTDNSNVTITHGGALVSINGPISSGGSLSMTGLGITTGTGGTLIGAPVILNGGSGNVILGAAVNATGGFSSNASGLFSLLSTGSITTDNTNVVINYPASLATINGVIDAGTGTVTLTSAGVSEGAGGAIISGALALSGTGNFNMQRANQVGRLAADVVGILDFGNTVDMTVGTVGSLTGITTHGQPLNINASLHNLTATSVVLGGSIHLTANLITIAGGLIASGTAGVLTATGNTIFSSTASALSILVTGDSTVNGDLTATSGDISLLGTNTIAANMTASGNVFLGNLATDVNNFSGNHFVVSGGAISISGPVSLLGSSGTEVLRANGVAGIVVGGSVSAAHSLQMIASAGGINVGGGMSLTGSGTTTLTAAGTSGIAIGGSIIGSQKLAMITNSTAGVISLQSVGTGTASRYTGSITLTANSAPTVNGVVLNGDLYVSSLTFDGAHLTVPTVATIISPSDRIIDASNLIDMKTNQKLTVLGNLALRSHAAPTVVGMFLGDIGALGTIVIDAGGLGASGLGRINLRLRTPQGELSNQGTTLANDGGVDLVSYSLNPVSALDAGFGTGVTTIAIRGSVSIIGVPGPVNISTTKVQVTSTTANLDVLRSADGDPNAILLFPPDQGGVLTASHGVPIIPRIIDPNSALNTQLGDISGITKQLSASNGVLNQLTAADLLVSGGPLMGTYIDLVPSGTTGDSPTPSAQAALIPPDVQTLFPERGEAISGALAEALQQLGIYARPLDAEELVDELLGRGMYNDTLRVLTPVDSSHTVAVNRLPSIPVIPVVEAARRLMYREETDDKGNTKLVSKTDEVAAAIGLAWQAYLDENAAKNQEPKPAEFRKYLELHEKDDSKFALALNYINQTRDLLTQIKQLGLTPTEFDVSRRVILNKLRDKDRIDEKDFALMIDGPSSLSAGKVAVESPPPAKP